MLAHHSSTTTRLERFADSTLALVPTLYSRQAVLLGVAAFMLYVAIAIVVSYAQPQTDWDALAYLGIAAERLYDTPAALHAYAYGVVEASVKPAAFIQLTQDGGGYRSQMLADPAGFVSMFGMYRVKWLYIEAVAGLSHFMEPMTAMRVISGASALAVAGVVLLWLKAERALVLAPVIAAILALMGYADLARGLMPDMLFSMLLLAGLYTYMQRQETITGLLLFVAFLVRPDNIIFLGVFSVLLTVYGQRSWGVFAAIILSAVLFVPITKMTGQPGWWEQLYFASVEHQPTLEGFSPAFSIAVYLGALAKQFLLAVTAQSWVAVLILGLTGWFVTTRAGLGLDKRSRVLMLAVVLGVAAKFILVPIFDTRIYFAYVLTIFLILSGRLVELYDRFTQHNAIVPPVSLRQA